MNLKKVAIDKLVVTIFVWLACFGQPNAVYLAFPLFGALFMASLFVTACYFAIANNLSLDGCLRDLSINKPLAAFVFLSLLSVLYSLDQAFSLRSLSSSFVKPLMFYLLMISSFRIQMNSVVAGAIKWAAVFFSATGILLFVNIVMFGMQPIGEIGSVAIGGGLEYEQQLRYYGILGFVRSETNLLDLVFPRIQSYFAEPGYFGFFLELSLFSTLYCMYFAKHTRSIMRFGLLTILVQLVALCLSLSLGAIISVCLGAVVFSFCAGKINFSLKNILGIGIGIILLSAIVVFSVGDSELASNPIVKILVMERFESSYGGNSADTRMDALRAGVGLLQQKPLFGWGFGQTRIALEGMGANNSFITVFAELGMVGLVLYVLMLYMVYRAIKHSLRLSHGLGVDMVKATSAVAGLMAALTFHTLLIDASWTFIYWLGISLVFLNQRFVIAHAIAKRSLIHTGHPI